MWYLICRNDKVVSGTGSEGLNKAEGDREVLNKSQFTKNRSTPRYLTR